MIQADVKLIYKRPNLLQGYKLYYLLIIFLCEQGSRINECSGWATIIFHYGNGTLS